MNGVKQIGCLVVLLILHAFAKMQNEFRSYGPFSETLMPRFQHILQNNKVRNIDFDFDFRSRRGDEGQALTLSMIDSQKTQDPFEESAPLFTLDSKTQCFHM